MSPEQRIQRAERARQLLGDKLLTEGFDAIANAYIMALRQCPAKDDIGRYRYSEALNIIDGVKRHLTSVLNDGKLAAKEAQEFQSQTAIQKIARVF